MCALLVSYSFDSSISPYLPRQLKKHIMANPSSTEIILVSSTTSCSDKEPSDPSQENPHPPVLDTDSLLQSPPPTTNGPNSSCFVNLRKCPNCNYTNLEDIFYAIFCTHDQYVEDVGKNMCVICYQVKGGKK
jgi:hypothetical protein